MQGTGSRSYPPIAPEHRLQVDNVDLADGLRSLLSVGAGGMGRRCEASLPVHHENVAGCLWLHPAAIPCSAQH